jgi:ankyrin repeat protein
MLYIRYLIQVLVLIGFSNSFAGSFDDYFSAIELDNVAVVSALMDRGFDPNTVNPQGQHGLFVALRVPALKVVTVLLAQPSVNVDARNLQDESPLMIAALRGFLDVCEKLIARGADINKPGWTPLHYAATGGHLDVLRLVLSQHAYIDAASPNGSTPLMMAAMYGSADAVKLLLDAGADSTLKNDLGLTAIDFAKQANRADSVGLIAASIRTRVPKGAW